jgi:hypothetical protein
MRYIKIVPALSSVVLLFATDEAYSTWMYQGLSSMDDLDYYIAPVANPYPNSQLYQVGDIRVHPLAGFRYAVRMYPIQQRYINPNRAETFDYVAWAIQDNHYEEVVVAE